MGPDTKIGPPRLGGLHHRLRDPSLAVVLREAALQPGARSRREHLRDHRRRLTHRAHPPERDPDARRRELVQWRDWRRRAGDGSARGLSLDRRRFRRGRLLRRQHHASTHRPRGHHPHGRGRGWHHEWQRHPGGAGAAPHRGRHDLPARRIPPAQHGRAHQPAAGKSAPTASSRCVAGCGGASYADGEPALPAPARFAPTTSPRDPMARSPSPRQWPQLAPNGSTIFRKAIRTIGLDGRLGTLAGLGGPACPDYVNLCGVDGPGAERKLQPEQPLDRRRRQGLRTHPADGLRSDR
jgi:hypothetical protein